MKTNRLSNCLTSHSITYCDVTSPNFQTCKKTVVRWGKLRGVGGSLHYIMVAITRGSHVTFQMSP